MTGRLLVLAAAVAAVAPATAGAAAPWGDPSTIGPAVANAQAPAATFFAPGTALLSWAVAPAEPPAGQAPPAPDRAVLTVWRPDRAPVLRTVRGDRVSTAVCGNHCLAVLREDDPVRYDRSVVLRVSVGSGLTRLGRVTTLARYRLPDGVAPAEIDNSHPVVAANSDGAIAVAWTEPLRMVDGAPRGSRLQVAMRHSGGTRWRIFTAAAQRQGMVRLPKLVFHGRDSLTVVYVRGRLVSGHVRRTVEARLVRPGRPMLAPQTLGPAQESYTDLQLVAQAGGRTLVAWGNVHGTIMGQADHWVVRAALRPANRLRFGAPQVLDPGTVEFAGAPGTIRVGLAPGGPATVAWSAYTAPLPLGGPEIRLAQTGAGGRFGAARRLASGELRDMSFAGPAAVATWLAHEGATVRVMAAVRRGSATAFDAPQVVAEVPTRTFNAIDPDPVVGLDAGTGRPIALWIADRTAGNQHVSLSTRLELAIGPQVGAA